MILLRNNNSLKRVGKVHNESHFHNHNHHHCTIELKNRASSCLHLFHKTSPVTLTTFKHDQQRQQQMNESNHVWKYQQNEITEVKVRNSPEKLRTVL